VRDADFLPIILKTAVGGEGLREDAIRALLKINLELVHLRPVGT
jgi:hypothetical protein